ncbi:MAG: hypothetical protein LBT54_07410, partial [Bifidobacteriaceae bacterium]|nr:hypothetical protein [Bifidobacteriaceae bacterium]
MRIFDQSSGRRAIAGLAAVAVVIPVGLAVMAGSAPAFAADSNIAFHRQVVVDNWTRTVSSDLPWWADQPQADAVVTETDQTGQLLTDGLFDPDGIPDFPRYSTGFTTAGSQPPLAYPYTPTEAFDGRKDTYWQIVQTDPAQGDPYIQIQLPAAAAVGSYALTNTGYIRNLSAETEADYREPRAWRLEGSADGAVWNVLSTQTGQSFDSRVIDPATGAVADSPTAVYTARRQTKSYAVTTAAPAYAYYRLVITDWDRRTADVDAVNQASNTKVTQPLAIADPVGLVRLAELDLFNSAQRSVVPDPLRSEWIAPAGNASATVDLGASSSISGANVVWDNAGAFGKVTIRVSQEPDPTWATVTPIVAGVPATGGSQAFSFAAQQGRYVHLELAESPNQYVIQEFQVIGSNDLSYSLPAAPAAAEDGTQELTGGGWELIRAGFEPKSGGQLSQVGAAWTAPEFAVPALVPGTVLQSYIAAGIIPDTNFADNQLQVSDRYFLADWWYRNEFQVPASRIGSRIWLNLDGINWKADVYVNGVFKKKIEGAFIDTQIDITAEAVPGANAVAVKVYKNDTPGFMNIQDIHSNQDNGGTLGADDPTYHASVGWDWIPVIRGRNVGIWDSVSVSYSQAVTLSNPWAKADVDEQTLDSAVVTVQTDLYNPTSSPVTTTVKGTLTRGSYSHAFESAPITVPPGLLESDVAGEDVDGVTVATFTVENAELWWPNGYGDHPLYDVHLDAQIGDAVSDSADWKFGLREMSYPRLDAAGLFGPARILTICVNGKRIVARGGNWGMADSNVTISPREYELKMRLHAFENLNMVRNWVGQTGDMAFYEAADRWGILIWDDFWLANPVDGPHPDGNAMFEENAISKIKRTRAHASQGIFVGRNEGSPPEPLNAHLRQFVADYDGTHDYIPNSADFSTMEVSGGGYYAAQERSGYFGPYFGFLPPSKDLPTLHSERGAPMIPTVESIVKTVGQDHVWPIDVVWGLHDYNRGDTAGSHAAQGLQSWEQYITNHYGVAMTCTPSWWPPTTCPEPIDQLKSFVEMSQLENYEVYQALFESVYVNKAQGMLLWMSSAAWPSFVWQTYDYFYDTNAGFYGIKKANQPVNVVLDQEFVRAPKAVLSNATIAPVTATVVTEVFDAAGAKLTTDIKTMTVAEADIAELYATLPGARGYRYIRFTVLDATTGEQLSENFYWINDASTNDFTDLAATPNIGEDYDLAYAAVGESEGTEHYKVHVKNNGAAPIVQLHLKVQDQAGTDIVRPTYFSDNYFFLMPGESRDLDLEFDTVDRVGAGLQLVAEGRNVATKSVS